MERENYSSANELRKSLSLVIIAAAFCLPFSTVVNGPALTGFIRKLDANDFVYSVIMAMPLIGAIIQMFFSYILVNYGKRKPLFIIAGFIHRPIWIVIAFVPIILGSGKTKASIMVITILIAVSSAAGSVVGMTFRSWMGDLVPAEIRGRFFSRRMMVYTITGGVSALVCGLLLDRISGFGGYAVVFVAAALLGTVDIAMFFWVKEPHMQQASRKQTFSKLFAEPFKDRNYFKYILIIAFWQFSVNVASPFFNVFMIEELKMKFLTISLFTQVASNLFTILFVRLWGKLADRYGSKPVMVLCCFFLTILPVLWLFATPKSTWVVMIINIISGLFLPGFEMNALNQSIWLAPEKNRSVYIASYSLIVILIGTGAAYLCGGAFMQFTRSAIPVEGISIFGGLRLGGYQMLFIISGLLRLLVLLFGIQRYEEKDSRSVKLILNEFGRGYQSFLKACYAKHSKYG